MIIYNINSNRTFCSRDASIRFADDICRQTNNAFVRMSSTKVQQFKKNEKCINVLEKLSKRINETRAINSSLYDIADSFIAEILAILKPTIQNKVGNCGESSHFGTVCAKINGIDDCYPVNIFKSDGEDLDHMVVYVHNNGKPYIIDPWLGFADYLNNAIARYKYDYYSIFKVDEDETITVAAKYDDGYTETLKNNFTRRQKNKLAKIFPRLKINKYYSE